MDRGKGSEDLLFPTKTSLFIFWSYISLFVSQGLLVTAVQRSGIEGFNATIVVLSTEGVKLIICVVIYSTRSQRNGSTSLLHDLNKNRKLLAYYLVPAFLYCLYNNLTFINLELFDVATYYCLMQFRIVVTGVIYQVLFKRQLTSSQWASLLILTSGCIVKEYAIFGEASPPTTISDRNQASTGDSIGRHILKPSQLFNFFRSTSLLLLQMFCSCFAGVYNEYLLKDSSTANNADVIVQNIFMYIDSIICNLIVFNLAPDPNHGIETKKLSISKTLYNLLSSPMVIVLITNNALSGLVASFFLKSLNSILKTFASAIELFAVTFLAWLLFNSDVDASLIVALILVTLALFIYSRDPVSVAAPANRPAASDGFVLLPTTED